MGGDSQDGAGSSGHRELMTESTVGVDGRVGAFARGTDLGWVAEALASRRADILERWLDAAAGQAFHHNRRELAIGEHVPALFDAVVALLRRAAPRWVDARDALDDPAVLDAAQEHARSRVEQGLRPTDVVVEFRLLRQEIGRALRLELDDSIPARDVVGAELLLHDAFDGAMALALAALTHHVDEARQEFLGTTMHEVGQPLTGIKGAVQLAVRSLDRGDVEGARDALRRADASADQMRTLLRRLSDLARLGLRRYELHKSDVNMFDVVSAVVARLDPEAGRRVRVETTGSDPIGHWDPAALDQVVANLLSNALKYSEAEVDVVVRADPRSVQLTVQDRGIGLAPDEVAGLFRRYGRARSATEREIGGLGLGLYIVRGIVEAHGGRVWAESPGPGQGTSVHALLPRMHETPGESSGGE
jgi:signal transduction histidine kinase